MEKVREFTYQKLTPQEQQKRGILGRLVGTIADFKNPTRNGRLYTESLWDQVFNDPITKEKIATKTILGELNHPRDREEIDMEKVAISLAEVPKKCTDGTVKGVFDILDTPNGRILKTLCDYGCKIGVSSRGTGDVVEDWSGNQTVDPKSYQFECFDAVLLPSVKAARPSYVNESLEKDNGLRKALNEDLNKATPNDKKIMQETLKQLNIDIIDKKLNEDVNTHNNSVINKNSSTTVGNAEVDEAIKSLQESLKQKQALELQVKALNEKLSVCNAKETRMTEALQQSRNEASNFKKELEKVNAQVDSLQSQLDEKSKLVESQDRRLKMMSKRIESQTNKQQQLTESMTKNTDEVKRLTEQLNSERSKSKQQIASLNESLIQLNESLEEAKQDTVIKDREMAKKMKHAQQLIEHYKKVANTAVDKYIISKAKVIGVKPSDIKSRLDENYSFKDIDSICEEIVNNQLNVTSLPFNVKKPVKVSITESKEPIVPKSGLDDDIDPQLMSLAGTYFTKI